MGFALSLWGAYGVGHNVGSEQTKKQWAAWEYECQDQGLAMLGNSNEQEVWAVTCLYYRLAQSQYIPAWGDGE